MKQISIEGTSYNDIYDRLYNTLKENLKEMNDDGDPDYCNIRISRKDIDDLKAYIRLSPTYDITTNEVYHINYVNVYLARRTTYGRFASSLLFSERYNSGYFDISLATVTTYLLKVFDVPIEDGFKEKVAINVIIAGQSYSKVNLEERMPSVMANVEALSRYVYTKVIQLSRRNPTLSLYFHTSIEDIDVPDNATIQDEGVFYISFSYNDHLSAKYNFGMYNIAGILPSAGNDSGIIGVGDAIPDYALTECIESYCAWYFKLRDVLVDGERMGCFIEEIPYFQEII